MEGLDDECYRAVLLLKKKRLEIELDEYTYVLGYATPEMEAFDKLIKIVDNILKNIKAIDKELKTI
jgi:hypothetical protein